MHISALFKSFDSIRFRKTSTSGSKTTGGVAPRRAHTFKCPVCESPMDVSAESALPEFGRSEIQLHEMECMCCGMVMERFYNNSKGYEATSIPSIQGRLHAVSR